MSVVGKWPVATNRLIEKLSSDYKPIKIIKFKEFFAKLKSFDGTDYNLLVDEIGSYKKVHDIWFKLQNTRANSTKDTSDKISPFCVAISQGLRYEVLNAFIDCGWDLKEFCCRSNLITSPMHLAFNLHNFKIFHTMAVKINKNVNDKKEKITLVIRDDVRHINLHSYTVVVPASIPPFKTFDDRLDFIRYLHYAMGACDWIPDPINSAYKVLQWYRKYQAAIFAAIICKADHLPRLNKDVIWAISEFIS